MNNENITLSDILGETAMSSDEKKEFIENKLMSINRTGMDRVIEYLRKSDFYYAPSSTRYHSDYRGGLVDHSILVMQTALHEKEALVKIRPELEPRLSDDSVILSALLHDICKCNFYKDSLKWKKNDETGQWMQIPAYDIDDKFPIGHGEKSVIILLSLGLRLTVDEMLAIRYHMGLWSTSSATGSDSKSFMRAIEMCPLLVVLQAADFISSFSFEAKIKH